MLIWPLLLAAQASAALHVPSPDWRDQVVYFLMTDRFENGDPSNDSQGAGEFKAGDPDRFNGGDLAGIKRRLGYIQGLGATAVWLTPPVANVWWDPALKMAGYHGYWAENFREVDKHLGTLADYRALSEALHSRKMFLIQDIVANHTGDFLLLKDGKLVPKAGVVPPAPTQPPFDRAESYHATGDIVDFNDPAQRLSGQLSGLDDLDTGSPAVREALRASYDHWIASAGVDAFRIDTAHYVEHEFWKDFVHSHSTAAYGTRVFAKTTGRGDFLNFGEVWVHASPFSEEADKTAAAYLEELGAVLNFPLAEDLRATFAKGAPPARLAYRLGSLVRNFQGGRGSVNFIDNHDMTRFLAEGSREGLEQALAALLTLPGLPVIYAGTEQGLIETRGAMFGRFDDKAPLYKLIRGLVGLRRAHPVLSRGRLKALDASSGGPGLLAYRLEFKKEYALVLFNTSEEELLAANLAVERPAGEMYELMWSRANGPKSVAVASNGTVSLTLPGKAALVLLDGRKRAPAAAPKASASIDAFDARPMIGPFQFYGSARGTKRVRLVVDGMLSNAVEAEVRLDGRWGATVDATKYSDGEHSLVALTDDGGVSESRPFTVSVPWETVASIEDPAGDDRGPTGKYRYPTAPGFQGRGDIRGLTLARRGRDARLTITMAGELSTDWNPPFGFDHVCFRVVVERGGSKTEAFLGGWKTSNASAVSADKKAGTVEAVFEGAGSEGARFYVSTWDYDGVEGKLRALAMEPSAYVFGGGPPDGPLVLDDAALSFPHK
ncbi:MAG: DUF3459 domain-containing protein [Elusimicrobia bacterium]|nr:DUF3459 domain-containing protein [Elusimicrobiota bacterium]